LGQLAGFDGFWSFRGLAGHQGVSVRGQKAKSALPAWLSSSSFSARATSAMR
jgi:hypothetical protein